MTTRATPATRPATSVPTARGTAAPSTAAPLAHVHTSARHPADDLKRRSYLRTRVTHGVWARLYGRAAMSWIKEWPWRPRIRADPRFTTLWCSAVSYLGS